MFPDNFSFSDWLFNGLSWQFFYWLIILFIGERYVYRPISGIWIAYKILENNRSDIGKGYGSHAADIYLQLWEKDQKFETQITKHVGNATRQESYGNIAKKNLVKYGLVEIKEKGNLGDKIIMVKKDLRGKVIRRVILNSNKRNSY